MNPQPTKRRPENRARFQRVSPGDSNANQRVLKRSKNTGKQDRPPKKGEPGYGLTRASAIQQSTQRGKELLSKIDTLLKKK